jgi:hypothetical protein
LVLWEGTTGFSLFIYFISCRTLLRFICKFWPKLFHKWMLDQVQYG